METIATTTTTQYSRPSARPFYTRLAALGFALVTLTGVVASLYELLTGDTASLAFSLPILIIGLLVTGALLRFGVWAQVLAGILSLAVLALLLPFSTFVLMHPEDGGNFIPSVLLVVGAALAFVGCIVSLVQRRRHALRESASPVESAAVKVVLAALAVVAALSVIMSVTARTTVSAETKASALGVEITSFSFLPNHLEVKPGDMVRIVVKNSDPTLHTFTLPEAGVDTAVPPGSEKLIEFKSPAAGVYRWYCIPHSDPGPNGRTGMVGVLQVQ